MTKDDGTPGLDPLEEQAIAIAKAKADDQIAKQELDNRTLDATGQTIGVKLGDSKHEIEVPVSRDLSPKIWNYLPYMTYAVITILGACVNIFHWNITYTNQQVSDIVSLVVMGGTGAYYVWRHNPLTKKAILKDKLAKQALDIVKKEGKQDGNIN